VSGDLAVKLAHAHFFLADGALELSDELEKRDLEYQRGLDWATQALKIEAPDFAAAMAQGKKHSEAVALAPKEAVPAMYWYASNLGKWVASKGAGTRLAYKDEIKSTMDRVRDLDADYFYAGPWRHLGFYEALAAGTAGGDLAVSRDAFEKAASLAPLTWGPKYWRPNCCVRGCPTARRAFRPCSAKSSPRMHMRTPISSPRTSWSRKRRAGS